jgi:hypothetical protein
MPIRSILLAALAAVALAEATALAQTDPKFAYGTKEEKAELEKKDAVEWKALAQAGFIMLTGNSRATTVAGSASASRKANRNKFALDAGAAYSRSSIYLALDQNANGTIERNEITRPSQTTTRMWSTKGRYDRYLTDDDALYAALGFAGDEPAGKELVANGQLGYSRQVYQDAVHLVLAEAGYDYTHEELVAGTDNDIHSLRAFAGYGGKLSPDTGVDASVEGLFNVNEYDTPNGTIDRFEDNRVTSKLALTTKMYENVSFRFGFEARFDNAPSPRPPLALPYAPGFAPLAEELDTKTEATLIVNFL